MRRKRLLTLLSCLGLAAAFALAAFLASQLMRRSQRDRPHSYSPEQLRVDLDGTLGQSGICGDALTWVFSAGDGTLTVSGSGEMYEFDAERFADGVPWHEYTALIRRVRAEDGVTSVSDRAFSACPELVEVVLADSVKAVDDLAFNRCPKLERATLNGVETLGAGAFSSCGALRELEAARLRGVGANAFQDCAALTGLPGGLEQVAQYAFKGCTALTAVRIPAGAALGEGAFYACTGLTELTLEDGVQTLGELCFYGCTALTAVRIPGSVAELPTLVFGCCTALRTLTLENGVAAIGVSAFQECRALTKLTLPESLRSVGGGAFFACTGLASLRLPEGLERVGDEAFLGCLALDPAALSLPASLKSVGRRAFACGSLLSETCSLSAAAADGESFAQAAEALGLDPAAAAPQYADARLCSQLLLAAAPDVTYAFDEQGDTLAVTVSLAQGAAAAQATGLTLFCGQDGPKTIQISVNGGAPQTFTLENTTGAQLLPLPASPGAAGQPTVLTITVLDRYGAGRFERLYTGLSAQ